MPIETWRLRKPISMRGTRSALGRTRLALSVDGNRTLVGCTAETRQTDEILGLTGRAPQSTWILEGSLSSLL